MRYPKLIAPVVCSLLFFASIVDAREFRRIAPIPVAPEVIEASGIDSNATPLTSPDVQLAEVAELSPIPAVEIEQAIQDILQSWNTEGLDSFLDQYFPNRFQLLNALSQDIPKDASLQLLSVQNVNTLSQVWGQQSQPRTRISSVIATVSLQLRFIDPFRGQITLPHTARFYLRVVESE